MLNPVDVANPIQRDLQRITADLQLVNQTGASNAKIAAALTTLQSDASLSAIPYDRLYRDIGDLQRALQDPTNSLSPQTRGELDSLYHALEQDALTYSTGPSTGSSPDAGTEPGTPDGDLSNWTYGPPAPLVPTTQSVAGPHGALQVVTMAPGQTELFGPNGPTGFDLHQGTHLGDCGFIASLGSVMASNPRLIQQNISGPVTGPDGKNYYTVVLYNIFNRPQRVTVDDELPLDAQGNPVTVPSIDPSNGKAILWPALYEKAYAAVHGGYQTLNQGVAADNLGVYLQGLTGSPATTTYNTSTSLSTEYLAAQAQPYTAGVLNIGNPPSPTSPSSRQFGNYTVTWSNGQIQVTGPGYDGSPNTVTLHSNHVYGVVKATPSGIILRNPWGDANQGLAGPGQLPGQLWLPPNDELLQAIFQGSAFSTVPPS